jgi:ribosome-associated protein
MADASETHSENPSPPLPAARLEEARRLAVDAARALADAKCEDIEVIDVSELSQVMNFLVIATGTSDRQMRSAADDAKEAAEDLGERVFGRSADPAATWIVMDFVDVVVHIFEPNARAYYDLETLWGDGPRVSWRRNGEVAPSARRGA